MHRIARRRSTREHCSSCRFVRWYRINAQAQVSTCRASPYRTLVRRIELGGNQHAGGEHGSGYIAGHERVKEPTASRRRHSEGLCRINGCRRIMKTGCRAEFDTAAVHETSVVGKVKTFAMTSVTNPECGRSEDSPRS